MSFAPASSAISPSSALLPWQTGLDWATLQAARPLLWAQDATPPTTPDSAPQGESGISAMQESLAAMQAASARLNRFAPLLAQLFPEALGASGGLIESPLLAVPALQAALGLPAEAGTLFVKADHALPVAGSIKARGGIHEVLEHAEALALRHGLLPQQDLELADYRVLASPAARALFAAHQVAVGSTGNLGLAIGVMAAALGFKATVHMSADAKEWKKARLRQRGVQVVEHEGDYAEAVAAGRRAVQADPQGHFVDDEHSSSLFMGYAVAAERLAAQLESAGRTVDAAHPLLVYLPCGVGGAPGGVAWALRQHFGANVHCFFAEPVQSPCFLLQLLVNHAGARAALPPLAALAANPQPPSVYDIGLSNRTEADGLAVARASELAGALAGPGLAGAYTVTDDDLYRLLHHAAVSEDLRLEPSATAGLAGPARLLHSEAGQAWLARRGLQAPQLAVATHVAWTTGGQAVPEPELAYFRYRAAELAREPADDPALRQSLPSPHP
ncbi:D-serine ammonia-lyase [Ideonella azotifigens]|uniref:D-serine ammonia-lyase n=2 Tax=Ideonella azotifigens TaxID=513160 RepID=UPI0035C08D9E